MSDDKKKLTIGVIGTGASNMRFLAGQDVGPAKITDNVTTPPLVTGPHSRAWQCNMAVARKLNGIRAEDDGTLVHWLIEAPWAHPVWHSYSLVLVHLRPMPGNPGDTVFYLDGATHELWLFAVDPKKDRNPMISTGLIDHCWMPPMNFGAQFIELDDDLAMIRISYAVQAICDGKLSPDTDYTHQWIELFGDNMIRPEWR